MFMSKWESWKSRNKNLYESIKFVAWFYGFLLLLALLAMADVIYYNLTT